MSGIFELSGQVAVVTGASRGLGQHFARALAGAGADLVLTSRRVGDLGEFAEEMRGLGRRVWAAELDVREERSVGAMAEFVQRECVEGVQILVNNAGCNVRKPAAEVTWAEWDQVVETNLRGSFFVAQAMARGMVARGYGRVVNIGSVTSVFGYPGLAPYGASRGGVRQMTMSLAAEWGRHGVTVNCLAPGWFRTEQNEVLYRDAAWVEYLVERIPLGRVGEAARDLSGPLVFLASEASRYVTGQTLLVDGGISVGSTRAMVRE